ncbi:MAG: exosortase/archaeosortase family protein [candidate division Zixibacteria bacterium]|nr:exosortase/archaeosortase family protein [candidate division Zixibacteria bacterium]
MAQNNSHKLAVPSAKLVLIPLAGLVLVYLPALFDLVKDWWNDPNYSHGFLIPIISIALIWKKKDILASMQQSTDRRGFVFLLLSLALFVVANGAAEYFTLRFSFVMALFGLTLYLLGPKITRSVIFPIFFLLFMIPIPYVIYYAVTFPMQILATKITVVILNTIGMNAIRQGNIIHIAEHTLEVAEACSGIRSLVSLLALSAIYAYFSQKRFIAQACLFLLTIPIAIAGNVFRVLVTAIAVAVVTDNITDEPFHSIMGLLVFVVAFILLFICGFILRRIFK